MLALDSLTTTRTTFDAVKVAGTAAKMRKGMPHMPPILVNKCDGGYLVRDGAHRVVAARQVGLERVPALVVPE